MKRHILAIALVALAPFAAHADTKDAYSGVDAVPEILLEKLSRETRSEQQYVTQVMSVLRGFGRSQTTLDQQDIDNLDAKYKRDTFMTRLRAIMKYDMNFDLKVTQDELRASLQSDTRRNYPASAATTAQEKERIKKRDDERIKRMLWDYDTDKDGVITSKEVGTLPEGDERYHRNISRTTEAARLLALDPDKDGVLTVPEIEALAHKAWRTADKDGDGAINADEKAAIDEAVRDLKMRQSGCVARPASANEKLVLVSVLGGGGIPDVSVAGQQEATGTVRLEIEKGEVPVYLVAVSGRPVIWQVTGDTARVTQMIVSGPLQSPARNYDYAGDNEGYRTALRERSMQAGVAGLEKAKVRFLKGEEGIDCARYLRGVSQAYLVGSSARILKAIKSSRKEVPGLETITGRKEDFTAGAFEPSGFVIDADDGKFTVVNEAPEGVPEGLDAGTWERALKFVPGGLVSFKGQEVLSDGDVEPYKILPGWAGLAQLVAQGALKAETPENPATRIVVTGNNMHKMVVRNMASAAVVSDSDARIIVTDESRYRLLRQIENFPPGLDGAYGVHFVVPKGLKMPEGRAGTSCVYSEENDEMSGMGSCY